MGIASVAPAWADDSKPTVEPYGYLELDSVYSSRNTNPLDPSQFNGYATAAGKDDHSSSTFNPRFSVLGIRATQDVGDNKLLAKVEADFYGSDTGNPEPRLRLAYIDWTNGSNRLTVGQDWLSVAQLLPSALDFSIMGYGGDLWQRIPQVTYRRKLADHWEGLFTVFRFARGQDLQPATATPFDDPVKSPYVGTRLAYTGWGAGQSGLAAISGAWRKFILSTDVTTGAAIPEKNIDSYLLAGELSVPILSMLHWNSKVGYGQALGDEFFRFDQAFNTADNDPIRDTSGFSELAYSPNDAWSFAAGAGIDDPNGSDLRGESSFVQYASNQRYYVNVTRKIISNFKVGLEYTHLRTKWTDGGTTYDGNQVMLSSWYSFWL